jgi:hypothetical protein
MATVTLQTGIPAILLVAGMKVTVEAISPTTGSAVTTVGISGWSIYGTQTEAEDVTQLPIGPFMFVPGPGA